MQFNGVRLENEAWFKYLGSIFAEDGSKDTIQSRISLVMRGCGTLMHIFDCKGLNLDLKLTIYKPVVTLLMTYGSEA